MIICAECGREVESDQSRCPFCGHVFGEPTESLKEVESSKSEILMRPETARSKHTEPIKNEIRTDRYDVYASRSHKIQADFDIVFFFVLILASGIALLVIGLLNIIFTIDAYNKMVDAFTALGIEIPADIVVDYSLSIALIVIGLIIIAASYFAYRKEFI